MRTTQQLSITLPTEMAEMVNAKVQAGDYASSSEVIRAGLRALTERDDAVEMWLRDVITERAKNADLNPSALLGIDDVRATVAKRLATY